MIEFVNVSKIYPEILALEDINLEIEEKEFTFLTGPSGSGKTTLIKLLIKEEKPSEGSIFFYDTDVSQLKGSKIAQLRREIGVVFQDFKLLPNKNLYENISFVLEVSGKKSSDIEETVSYVLNLVGLSERAEAFPDEISGGEQQKIAIARAIANNPKVLIADEPTGNLDPESSWDIIKLLSKINEWGTTVIMATHGTDIINTLGKRVIELDKGKITSDNKKGTFPKSAIPIVIPEKDSSNKHKQNQKQKELNKKLKTKDPTKEVHPVKPSVERDSNLSTHDKSTTKKSKNKKKHVKQGIEEKEFEITFTTKSKIPALKKSKKKRKGKDVVDLYKLNLPTNIEEKLIKAGISTIDKLRKTSETKLNRINGFGKKQIRIILKKLDNNLKK